jgi:hypothetical protein
VALADGKELIRATALFQREHEVGLPNSLPGHPLPLAQMQPDVSPVQRFPFAHHEWGYPDLVETRMGLPARARCGFA